MTPTPQPSKSERLHSVDQLVEFFRAQGKPERDFRIGLEHEKIGLRRSGVESVPFDGASGIEEVLHRLASRFGYERSLEDGRTIGLHRGSLKVSLEPGGQLEFAGTPFWDIASIASELQGHLAEVGEVSRDMDCVWLALGENPLVPLAEIPWMPKQRYRIMRVYMPKRGRRGHYMMKATTTVQANIDFRDEDDACRKMRTSMGVSPIVTALYSNSSIVPADSTEFRGVAMDHRYLEWLDTDPDRCGLLPFVFQPDFSFRHYVEWLLEMPLYFLIRGGQLQDRSGESFRRLMNAGELDLEDFKLHMTTAFPEVRLKSTIELRGADNTPLPYLLALPALWKGLLYDDRAVEEAWKLVSDWTFQERLQLVYDVGMRGLEASVRGQPLTDLAGELLSIAQTGLEHLDRDGSSEAGYLAPLHERVRAGKSLAREAWDLWNGTWNRDPEKLLGWARLV